MHHSGGDSCSVADRIHNEAHPACFQSVYCFSLMVQWWWIILLFTGCYFWLFICSLLHRSIENQVQLLFLSSNARGVHSFKGSSRLHKLHTHKGLSQVLFLLLKMRYIAFVSHGINYIAVFSDGYYSAFCALSGGYRLQAVVKRWWSGDREPKRTQNRGGYLEFLETIKKEWNSNDKTRGTEGQ